MGGKRDRFKSVKTPDSPPISFPGVRVPGPDRRWPARPGSPRPPLASLKTGNGNGDILHFLWARCASVCAAAFQHPVVWFVEAAPGEGLQKASRNSSMKARAGIRGGRRAGIRAGRRVGNRTGNPRRKASRKPDWRPSLENRIGKRPGKPSRKSRMSPFSPGCQRDFEAACGTTTFGVAPMRRARRANRRSSKV